MKRVLQRHGKIIMTLMGIVLMIVFALPAFNSARDITGDTIGRLNGKKVTNRELLYSNNDMNLLKSFGLEGALLSLGLDDRSAGIHWYLLVQEATKYGYDAMPVTDEQINEQFGGPMGLSKDMIDIQLSKMNSDRASLRAALTHLQMIQQLRAFAYTIPEPTSAIELVADKQLTKVKVSYATFDAVKDATSGTAGAAPSEDAIQKQFDTYKAIVRTPISDDATAPLPPLPPVINGHRYPFGYKYPDRVAVEYLVFDRAALRQKFKVTQEDYDEAYKYYKEHPAEFRNEASPAGVISTQPASKSFDDVKQALVERQVDARVTKQLNRMVERARAQASDPWRTVQVDLKGFKEALPVEKWAKYEKIADDISKNREFDGYRPEYQSTEESKLLEEQDLAKLPRIGKASFVAGNDRAQELSFPQLATHVRELVELTAKDPMGRLFLQQGIEGPTLRDLNGNLYIYRVKAAEKSHEPKNLQEVRTQVVDDLRLLATYERDMQAAEELAKAANKGNLASLAAAKNAPVQTTLEFSRLDRELPMPLQRITDFVDTAYKLVSGSLPPTPETGPASRPASAPTPQGTGVGATIALNNDNTLKAYTLQLVGVSPAKATDFADQRLALMRYVDPSVRNYAMKWFTLDALCDRLKYVPVQKFSEKKTEEG